MFGREGVLVGRQVPGGGHQREMLRDPDSMRALEERGRAFYRERAEERVMTREGV